MIRQEKLKSYKACLEKEGPLKVVMIIVWEMSIIFLRKVIKMQDSDYIRKVLAKPFLNRLYFGITVR